MSKTRVLVAVSGGIAAYKIPELVRQLQKSGAEVRCMLTESAREFVSPLVLETLTGHPAVSRLWGEGVSGTEHIEWARWPELVLVAPATAQTLARMAHGLADDFVSTVLLATRARVLVAPAMNTAMLENAATQANLNLLAERGIAILEPESGVLACGEEGAGKLPDPARIAEWCLSQNTPVQDWSGRTILITAGPTRTFIDAVRYITNPSTGLMGKALAEEALRRGARVHYILGMDKGVVEPAGRSADECSRLIVTRVTTALEMRDAALRALPGCEGVIATAAVMDYDVAEPSREKLKRGSEETTLRLKPSPDVLASLRQNARPGQWFMGFAAETSDHAKNGGDKLTRKLLDFVFANPVARVGETVRTGFGTHSNSGVFLEKTAHGIVSEDWPLCSKPELAAKILSRIPKLAPAPMIPEQ